MFSSLIDDIAIIIVIYNRRLHECETYNSLAISTQQIGVKITLIVIDNSPIQMYSYEEQEPFFIHYIHNMDNPGVSKAYNQGAQVANTLGKKWLLLTDQDTIFPIHSIKSYVEGITNNIHQRFFVPRLYYSKGLFSPVLYFFKRGWQLRNLQVDTHSFRHLSVVNSGILVSLELFFYVNGYNEKVKLDFSDYVFVDRIKKYNNTFTVLDIDCTQNVSFEANNSKDLSLLRFKYFCEGARYAVVNWYDYPRLLINVTLRTLKLTVQYKTSSFLIYLFHYFIKIL